MRRHWITTLLAYLCFTTAAALLYSILLLSLNTGAASDAPLYTAIWRILGLFPSPTSISWVVSFFAKLIGPAMVRSKIYSSVINARSRLVLEWSFSGLQSCECAHGRVGRWLRFAGSRQPSRRSRYFSSLQIRRVFSRYWIRTTEGHPRDTFREWGRAQFSRV